MDNIAAMPLMICPKCERFHYVPGDCPPPRKAAEGRGPRAVRVPPPNITATSAAPDISKVEAETSHLAPKKRGRPRKVVDRKAYKAEKERERRAKLKAKQ